LIDSKDSAGLVRKRLAKTSHSKGYEWYAVKTLTQADLDRKIDSTQARKLEADFFSQHPLWRPLQELYAQRIGIPHLQQRLSTQLTEHIKHELPHILTEVNNRVAGIEHQLGAFPQQPRLPTDEVLRAVRQLCDNIRGYVNGDPGVKSFIKDYRVILDKFGLKLVQLRPKPVLSTPEDKKKASGGDPIEISDDEQTFQQPTPTPKRRRGNGGQAVQVATPTRASSVTNTPIKSEGCAQEPKMPPVLKKITLEYVKSKYLDDRTSGLPSGDNPK
jgi:hypothetical protein